MGIINGTPAVAPTFAGTASSMANVLAYTSGQSNAYVLENILSNYPSLGDADNRKALLGEMGIDEGNENFAALDEFLAKLAESSSGFDTLYTALEEAAAAAKQAATADEH